MMWFIYLKVAVKTALSNIQECQRRGLNAKEYALNNFSWDAIAQQVIQAYQEIIAGVRSQNQELMGLISSELRNLKFCCNQQNLDRIIADLCHTVKVK
jgi:hypothetical protein